MAVTEFDTISAVSISGTEISILSGTTTLTPHSTTPGAYQLYVDGVAAGMAKGDVFEVRIYEKPLSGSSIRTVFVARMNGAQTEVFVTPPLMLLNGWNMTLKKISGTDRSFDASIRKAG
jgi:hypothetical protein